MNEAKFWRSGYAFAIAALAFLFVGLYTFYLGFSGLLFNLSVSEWKKVDASVHSVKVKPYYIKSKVRGYYLTATYTYDFNSKKYTANNVAPDATFGNNQKTLMTTKSNLEKASKESKIKIFVNPKKPQEAFICRNKPIKPFIYLFAGSLFLTLSLVLLLAFFQKKNYEDFRDEKRLKFPEQPWLWERYWQNFEQTTQANTSKLLPIWGLTIFLGITSIIAATIVGWNKEATDIFYWGVAFLFVSWLGSVYFLVARVKGLKQSSDTKLVVSSYPVVLGETWKAKIIFKSDINTDNISICARSQSFLLQQERRTDDVREINQEELNFSKSIAAERVGLNSDSVAELNSKVESMNEYGEINIKHTSSKSDGYTILNFEFTIPDVLDETDLDKYPPVRWELVMRSHKADSHIFESFHIPVFKRSSFSKPQINSKFDQ